MGRAGKSKNGQNPCLPDHTAQANIQDDKENKLNRRHCTT